MNKFTAYLCIYQKYKHTCIRNINIPKADATFVGHVISSEPLIFKVEIQDLIINLKST